jgi:hypothetical protein
MASKTRKNTLPGPDSGADFSKSDAISMPDFLTARSDERVARKLLIKQNQSKARACHTECSFKQDSCQSLAMLLHGSRLSFILRLRAFSEPVTSFAKQRAASVPRAHRFAPSKNLAWKLRPI